MVKYTNDNFENQIKIMTKNWNKRKNKNYLWYFQSLNSNIYCYFLISSSIKNNFIFIHHFFPEGIKSKAQFFVVGESRSILYSSRIVCLRVDWFTGYNGIMIEH